MKPEKKCALELAQQAAKNLKKWGAQDLDTLGLALAEETGELCQAILQARYVAGPGRVREEALDAGALCIQVLLATRPKK